MAIKSASTSFESLKIPVLEERDQNNFLIGTAVKL